MLLKETNRTVSVNAVSKDGEFTYNVGYTIENKSIKRLNCDISQTVKVPTEVPGGETQNIEHEVNLGYIILESGNKNIVLVEDADITAHLEVFDKIVAEVKGQLTSK